MKKALIAAAAAVICMTAGTMVMAEENTDILAKIAEVNKFENFLTSHQTMQIDYKYIFEEDAEAVEEQICFADQYFTHTAPDYSYFHIGDNIYGFDGATERYYALLAMDASEDEYLSKFENIPYYFYDENEKVVSLTEEDGKITLELLAEVEVEGAETETQKTIMLVDAETYEIENLEFYVVDEEEEFLFCTVTTSYDVEFTEETEVSQKVYGDEENYRDVKLIANPGTAEEKTFAVTLAKDIPVNVVLAEGYDTIYADAECTEVFAAGKEFPEELSIYTKKAE